MCDFVNQKTFNSRHSMSSYTNGIKYNFWSAASFSSCQVSSIWLYRNFPLHFCEMTNLIKISELYAAFIWEVARPRSKYQFSLFSLSIGILINFYVFFAKELSQFLHRSNTKSCAQEKLA